MKNFLMCVLGTCLFYSCKVPNYYPTPVYAPVFANRFEVQGSGVMGTNGFTTKTGFATTKNISVGGTYNSIPGISTGVKSHEAEAIAGFQFKVGASTVLAFHSGSGFGSNYRQDSGASYKRYRGNFVKPFGIITIGSMNTKNDGKVYGDVTFSLKGSYLMYNGFKTYLDTAGKPVDTDFKPENFIWEPYVNGTIGGKYVRFETGMGLAWKRLTDVGKGNKVFPIQMNLGITFIILRKYKSAEVPVTPTN
jgi:hypothetical protein